MERSTPRGRLGMLVVASVLALTLLPHASAGATFAGANGRLVFSKQGRIFTMDPDGSARVRLTRGGNDYSPVWSPTGTQIAFVRYTEGKGWAIWVMSPDGSGRRRVSGFGRGIVQPPIWSPTGAWIAYWDWVGESGAIWRASPDGSQRDRLTGYGNLNAVRSWAPDGTKLAYESNADGDVDVWVMNASGTGKTKLTQNDLNDFDPRFSPDGASIAFYRNIPKRGNRGDKGTAIWAMDSDGTDEVQLTDGSRFDIFPRWSPDGDWMAFRGDTYSRTTGAIELYRMSPDGTGLAKLTGPEMRALVFNWSPDSGKLVFVNGHEAILTMDADGTDQVTLLQHESASLGLPDWQAI